MDKEIRVLEDIKSQIDKGRTNFKKSPKERITEFYIKARLEGLEDIIKNFTNKHEHLILTFDRRVLEESSYMKNDTFDLAQETYFSYKSELNTVLDSIRPKGQPSNSSSNNSKESVVRLPKITIPFFSGNYVEWSSFKDLFTALVHNNTNLDDVQRLHYLKTQLKGEAEQLIKHIPITHNNYVKCWELLQSRYDNKRYISNCVLKRLFSLRSMTCESAQVLKELLDTTSDCLHELSNLGIKVDTWDVIIIYILSLKLDVETRKQWELHINGLGNDLPTYVLFKEFIESRFRALEFVEPLKGKSKPTYSTKVLHTTANLDCPHCHENHRLYSCEKFVKESLSGRQNIVKTLGLCYNCLGNNHFGNNCRVITKCRVCKGKHHTLLHGKSQRIGGGEGMVTQPDTSCETRGATNIQTHLATGKNQILLATALVRVESSSGSQILRALLDQGSQGSFISEGAVQLLRLKKIANKCLISGLGDKTSSLASKFAVNIKVQSLSDSNYSLDVNAHVIRNVTSILPNRSFSLPEWSELGRIHLADPQYNTSNKIDILLGSEVYCAILKEGLMRSPNGSTIAQNTCLGWVLSGQVGGTNATECHNAILNLHVHLEENELLKKFWELEAEPGINKGKILTSEEQACEAHFKATTCRDASGRYVVELPFRTDMEREYGNTRSVAVKRLCGLERRLAKHPEQKREYYQVLNEYLTLGHMEMVSSDSNQTEGKVWLPHHAVVRPDKITTRTRVVFNASEKSGNGVSLNSTLMVGPTLQPELRHTLMRWRMHPICLTADIVKMYRQVRIAARHTDFQRIVWREDANDEMHDYRLLTVTFGTSCAPYLAVKALQQLAIDEGSKYPLAACRVSKDFYMDDLLSGCQIEAEAVNVYKEMNALLAEGGFILQKWSSNRKGLLEPEIENSESKLEFKEDDITKVVGLIWNRRTDEFAYSVNLSSDSSFPLTKREIIAEICRLYDPLGWIAPCIITAKIFIQKLWIAGLDWDDKLPEELIREWKLYREELSKLVHFHIPRWVQRTDDGILVELHGFGDASSAAYAAVVYIRCIASDGSISTHLIPSKTKVAPIKQISIPRLELCGAGLIARLLVEVAEALSIPKSNLHAWTDSTVVLAWLSDHPSRWKTFIANRTSEILNLLDTAQWSYVQSRDNPADCASRGIPATELLNHDIWKYGPKWLRSESIPYGKPISICTKTDLEAKELKAHTTAVVCQDTNLHVRFSSLRKLIRVVAYCRRVLNFRNATKAKYKALPYLEAAELQESLTCCLRQHQHHSFSEEIASLLKQKKISSRSKISTLNPFLDKNGILRVGGRMENSDLPDSSKHPIIVCGDTHLAKLIVADAHEKAMHGGQQLTCNLIRSRYWITNLKNTVRTHIHHCVPCIRNAAKTSNQLMGQLPSCRVTPNKPFLHSGVDYAGPINIRVSKGRGQRSYKGYICLFICMATRAVHIEAVSDLTSEGFLSAFKRFIARRGRCAHLWSDNGTNFTGASRELKTLFASEQSSFPREVAASLANNGTEWHFIPPHAPNFGGLWEAGIKSTKHHLRRCLGDSTLTYEELATVLSQIEACLNSRPLSQTSTDPDDLAPLTPGHFLIGEPLVMAPDHDLEQIHTGGLRRWQLTQRMVQQFWRRWSQEYLYQFFQRYKWKTKAPELKIGDVVLVREDNLPPCKWLYGLVVDVHPGRDKITRVVTLRYKGSQIQRPTSKLCPLLVNSD